MQAYTDQQYRDLLRECGFKTVEFLPSLGGTEDKFRRDLVAILAR
jgi:hypothetical protein